LERMHSQLVAHQGSGRNSVPAAWVTIAIQQ